jgi:hypothetical protein
LSQEIITTNTGVVVATMSSIEIVDLINSMREEGKSELRHDNFMVKVQKVLGIDSLNFQAIYLDSLKREKPCYRLPKREASLLVMSESYAVQAKVYDRMVELESRALDPYANLPPEQKALVMIMLDNVAIKATQATQGQALVSLRTKVEQVEEARLLLSRPTASESIMHIRDRINTKYGIPPRIVDAVMRQYIHSPKPAGMVKNGHENAQGGSYAVYWTKDVNAVFKCFVNECTRETETLVTHPLITGRFRLNTVIN